MKKKEIQDERFVLRLNPDLKKKATKKANEDDRSLNKYIIRLIEKDLNNGIIHL